MIDDLSRQVTPTPASALLGPAVWQALQQGRPLGQRGRVVQAFGTTLRVSGLQARIGQQCLVWDARGARLHAGGDFFGEDFEKQLGHQAVFRSCST